MGLAPGPAGRLASRRRALLAGLGDPQAGLKVLHVAGTNGKGSTVAISAAVLRASGYRVGRFTSPDLNGPHERFWVDGATIAPDALEALLDEVGRVAERIAVDYPDLPPWRPFELWCAAAWRWFRAEAVDIAVVEAGMGGRTDATNVFNAPEATLVTAVGLDHTLCLGHDLHTVALEKAGIFRSGVPAMTTATGEALDTLAAEAARLGAAFRAVAPLAGRAHAAGGWAIELPDGPARLALGGRFQLENAALVLAAIESLNARGWDIPASAVRQGLAEVSWPGRMECLADPQGGAWLLDAAHNPAAVSALVSGWEPPGVALFGVQRSKEAAAMVAALSDGVRPLIFVPVPEAESWEPEELAAFAQGPTYAAPDVEAGLVLARRLAPTGLRVVTGSIYLVGAARARLLRSL